MTTTLYRDAFKLGMGHTAIITIDEENPLPCPAGSDWDSSVDHIRACMTIVLPTDIAHGIHSDLLDSNVTVAGICVTCDWGNRCPVGRLRTVHIGAETLADAVAMLRHKAECELSALALHVAKRAARIALRNDRLAFGRRHRPPQHELVVRYDVTGLPSGEVAAIAAEAVAQGEACEEHPDVTVRVDMPFPDGCVDPSDEPTARIRVPHGQPQDGIPEELDDWGQVVTDRSGPPELDDWGQVVTEIAAMLLLANSGAPA